MVRDLPKHRLLPEWEIGIQIVVAIGRGVKYYYIFAVQLYLETEHGME